MDTANIEAWHAALPESPKDFGTVKVCVLRPADGERALPDSIELDPETGIAGDIWDVNEDPDRKAQVSLINVHVVQSCADSDDPTRTALSGDNLQVDLDLGTENLPVGAKLEIGSTRLVITDQPHLPCKLFGGRYGQENVSRIAWSVKNGHRGRGVMCRIEQGGTIRIGDEVRVSR